MEDAQTAASAKRSPRSALLRCADLAEELELKAARLARAQEAVIVPSTAAFINAKQQWKFNDKAKKKRVDLDAMLCTRSPFPPPLRGTVVNRTYGAPKSVYI